LTHLTFRWTIPLTTEFTGRRPGRIRIQLLTQRVSNVNKKLYLVLWDMGAQLSLITNQYAKEQDTKGACLSANNRCRPRRYKEVANPVQSVNVPN
jgi:hypothetical protein